MKKIAAILLFSILLFNMTGYRWLFTYMENRATAKLEKLIDSGNYSEANLIEISIPLSMPYYSDQGYQTVYGETQWNGQHYRYVKRKITGNILYLLCLPHEEKNNIITAESNFEKAANNSPLDNPGTNQQTLSFIKMLLSQYLENEKAMPAGNSLAKNTFPSPHSSRVVSLFDPSTAGQPPELI